MSDEKRSIQDIVPPARSKPLRRSVEQSKPASRERSQQLPLKKRKKGSMFGLFGVALAVIVIIAIAFGVVSTFFHRAEVTITPYAYKVTIADTFNAAPDGQTLSYNTVSFETTLSKDVPSTASEYVEDRASGTITIYNDYSTRAQKLITRTRFETEDGLIYRIASPISVPGYTTSGGKKIPGSIEATVYADEPGEAYNVGVVQFTVPGLLESGALDAYAGIYARSNSSISGGFIGEKAVVDESVRDAAVLELRSELDRAAREGLRGRLSSDQFIVEDTLEVQFIDEADKSTENGAEVTVKAIATAPAFSERQVASLIAETGGIVFGPPLSIPNRDALTIQIEQSSDDDDTLGFLISGDAELVAVIDTEQFIRDIAGKDQGAVGSTLTRYPGIKDLNLSVYPFWRQTLPEKESRFTLLFDE